MGLVVFSLLLLCGAAFADLSAEYNNKTMLDSNYMVYWTYNATSDMMNIALEVKKTGWVAFGFTDAKSNNMKYYDVCIGYVDGNTTSLKDYLTDGHKIPTNDTTNNCMLDGGMESGGTTTLKYHRKVNTGDSQDRVIKTGEIIAVWAYRNTEKMLSAGKHDERGFAMVTMISSGDQTMTTKPTSDASTKLRGFYWNVLVTLLFVATALILK